MRPTTWLSDPVAFFQSDSILYVCDFQTDRVVIELTPVGAGSEPKSGVPSLTA